MRPTTITRHAVPAVVAGAVALAGLGPALSGAVVPSSVGVRALSTSQQAILASGQLQAKVKTGAPGSIKVVPKLQLSPAGSKPVKIGAAVRRRFENPGSAVLTSTLTDAGRQAISGCQAKTLLFVARLKPQAGGASKAAGRNRAVSSAPLAINSAGCGTSQSAGTSGASSGGGGGGGNANVIPPASPYNGPPINTANADRCDFLDPAVCLQPFPNDYFTVADPASDTGRRVNFNLLSMPTNKANKPIDNAELNRNDGFSPGASIIVRIPGLDNVQAFQNTDPVGIDSMSTYSDPNQPVVVINAATGERQPIWAELDYNPLDPAKGHDPNSPVDQAKVNLIIRPAVNFDEGARYIVALRNLKDSTNATLPASNAFRAYRDNLTTTDPAIEGRRVHMEQLFAGLGQAGIQRSSLYLTWDFTVASERNLSERMLHIRDDAFAQLGDTDLGNNVVEGNAPGFTVDSTTNLPPCNADGNPACAEDPITMEATEDNEIGRIVMGHVTVPCYMNTPACSPAGSTFAYNPADAANPDRLPTQAPGNTASVAFECIVPHTALDAPGHTPARVSLYGHGLLGSAGEVTGGNIQAMAAEHNVIFCATDWYGFATTNAANILAILQDVSLFPLLGDETQQGMLNFLYLGRLGIHANGLRTNAAFKDSGGNPIINTDRLLYDGNSQGGILGGALTAVAPDFRRAVLGVPAMNYSTLLTRSVDFEPYAEGKFTEIVCDELPEPFKTQCNTNIPADSPFGLYDNYPNERERPLIFALMQMLWDRAEPNGYAHHITSDPLPDTPSHQVLMQVAFGDHQVANVAADVEARTIGASVYQPMLELGRYWDPTGIFGVPAIQQFPFGGSALVYWDGGPLGVGGGTATPPDENIPPRPPAFGADPHSYPRNDVKARAQKSDFLQPPLVVNNYCTTANRPDPAFNLLVPNTGTAIPCHSHGWVP